MPVPVSAVVSSSVSSVASISAGLGRIKMLAAIGVAAPLASISAPLALATRIVAFPAAILVIVVVGVAIVAAAMVAAVIVTTAIVAAAIVAAAIVAAAIVAAGIIAAAIVAAAIVAVAIVAAAVTAVVVSIVASALVVSRSVLPSRVVRAVLFAAFVDDVLDGHAMVLVGCYQCVICCCNVANEVS